MGQDTIEGGPLTAADLADAAPVQLYPAWLPAQPRPIAAECAIHDLGTPVLDQPGGVLLLVGAVPNDPETAAAVRQAGERAYATVIVKARGAPLDDLVSTAEAAGVPLLIAADDTNWRDLDRLVSALVDAQGARTPAYAQVRPGDLFALANAIAYSVGGATAIEDRNGRMFAHSNLPHQKIDDIRLRSITERVTPTREGDAEHYLQVRNATRPLYFRRILPEQANRLAMPVRAGDELLGLIWVLDGDPALGEHARQALEDAARVTALHLLQIRHKESGRRWNRGQVLASLLSGRISAGAASALIDLPLSTSTTVLAIAPRITDEAAGLGAARTIDLVNLYCEAWHPSALATAVDDMIYALLPTPQRETKGRSVAGFARDVSETVRRTNGITLRIGIGPLADTLDDVPESRRLAELTLAAMDRDAPGTPVATVAEMRSRVILGCLADTGSLDLTVPGDPVARLVDHDQRRHTTYAESLKAYLDAFGDAAAAARALGIHENTLRYRIRRLPELAPIDLDDPDNRLVTWLQLRLSRPADD